MTLTTPAGPGLALPRQRAGLAGRRGDRGDRPGHRWPAELSIEVDPSHRGVGLGRALAAAARHLLPAGTPLWAQAAPANVASVRSLMSTGSGRLAPRPT